MAGSDNFTGQNIQDTYQRVLQISSSGQLADGTGSLVPLLHVTASYAVSASHEITYELSSSYAETASMASSNFNVQGDITSSGNISSSGNVYAADYFDNGVNINTLYAPVLGGNDNYVTDAHLVVIGNTSGTNTGDQNISNLAVTSSNVLFGNITASGNISASGNLLGANITINGNTSTFNSNIINLGVDSDDRINANSFFATRIHTTSNITSSGHISASGTIVGSNLSGTNTGDVTVTGTPEYITLSNQVLTRHQIVLTTDVTGVLPSVNLDADTAHLSGAQSFTGLKTFSAGIAPSYIKHTISGNNAGDYGPGAEILFGISAETTTAGVIYTLRSGVWTLIDANIDNRVDRLCAVAVGTNSSTDGMLIRGCVTLASAFTAGTDIEGVQVYASETAGQATITAPSDSGDLVRILGYSLNVGAKKMFFNPDSTFLEIA
jgi:hypothetical protein